MPGEQGSDGDRRLLDRAGFAQEFLRRNPLYRADWRKVIRLSDGAMQEQEVMARRWGLCFPVHPVSLRRGRTCALASSALTHDHHPR
ncbi:DUF6499 domain-containing protein [Sphingobium sp. Sx8-8]|uniref:transcriptional regulator domain-containing protein n=1 Tax=Sphingobium sp. Sx8-8 TaxID=2933617 RepID=UPI001F599650|nr:DUF6499 domain-containing protein [Sphingobium sp. Sx8-8]